MESRPCVPLVTLKDGNMHRPTTRELILFSRFTGNNKFMMMLLLICCAYSGKPVTRMWAALVNSVGCILFFVTMLPTLDDIKDQGGCDPKMPLTMSVMIGGLTVVWLSAAKAEYNDMKDEMKAEEAVKQKKSWALYVVHVVGCVLFFVFMLFMKIMGVMLGGLLVVWLYNDVMGKVTEDKADKKKK